MNNNDFNNKIQQLELMMFDSERDGDSIVFDDQALKAREIELLRKAFSIHSDKAAKRKYRRTELISILGSAACIVLIIAATFVFALKGLSAPPPDSKPSVLVALNTPSAKLSSQGGAVGNDRNTSDASGTAAPPSGSQSAPNISDESRSGFITWDNEDPAPTTPAEPVFESIQDIMSEKNTAVLTETTAALSNTGVIGSSGELSLYISNDYSLTSKIRTGISLDSVSIDYQYRLDGGCANITYNYFSADNPKPPFSKAKRPKSKPQFVKLRGGEYIAVYESNDHDRILAVLTEDTYAMTVSFEGISIDDAVAFLKSLTALSVR